jgi:hypothetical protein
MPRARRPSAGICDCRLSISFPGSADLRRPPLATGGRHHSAFPRRVASGFCIGLTPKKEGAGNAGCVLHPRPRVQIVRRTHTRKTGTDGAIRHSLRNGLMAYAALSSATNSSCHRRQRIKVLPNPVGPTKPPQAWHQQRVSGTTRFCRTLSRRSSCALWHRSRAIPPCDHDDAPTLSRPPHPVPRS